MASHHPHHVDDRFSLFSLPPSLSVSPLSSTHTNMIDENDKSKETFLSLSLSDCTITLHRVIAEEAMKEETMRRREEVEERERSEREDVGEESKPHREDKEGESVMRGDFSLSQARAVFQSETLVFLCHGGHFAGAVFLQSQCIAHKSIHKYVSRKKQGKR